MTHYVAFGSRYGDQGRAVQGWRWQSLVGKGRPDTDFLIVGDTFGFWELTLVRGVERLAHIIQAHQAIFVRATGARIKVTVMVGNHDYDLACDPAFVEKLQAESAIRRNAYLMGALELRSGPKKPGVGSSGPDTVRGMTNELLFDFIALRLNHEKTDGMKAAISIVHGPAPVRSLTKRRPQVVLSNQGRPCDVILGTCDIPAKRF